MYGDADAVKLHSVKARSQLNYRLIPTFPHTFNNWLHL